MLTEFAWWSWACWQILMLVKIGDGISFLNFNHNTSKYHRKQPPATQKNKAELDLLATATESTSHYRKVAITGN